MKIQRVIVQKIKESLINGKVNVLYRPRQVGKTTLAKDILAQIPQKSRFISADEISYRDILHSQHKQDLARIVEDVDILAIHEAQPA